MVDFGQSSVFDSHAGIPSKPCLSTATIDALLF